MEKTLTFTVEDALLSPISFAVLSGAGLFKGKTESDQVHVHTTSKAYVAADEDGTIDLTDALSTSEKIDATAPVFVMELDESGDLSGNVIDGLTVDMSGKKITGASDYAGKTVFVDFYVVKNAQNVSELQIDAENFGGYYYVEASTLFRRQSDGVDMPAEITIPNVKIQSNFTFSMASTGDPSTFTFTMDAFPGYTMFDKTRQVLCVMQVVEDAAASESDAATVMKHKAGISIEETENDSTEVTGEE